MRIKAFENLSQVNLDVIKYAAGTTAVGISRAVGVKYLQMLGL
jgi:hypothetical protein